MTKLPPSAPAAATRPTASRWRITIARLFESRATAGASVLLALIVLAALLAPWIAPQNPYDLASLMCK